MAATLKLNYKQVYNLAKQLTLDQQEKLARALTSSYEEAREASRPYTIEEVKSRALKSIEDIKAGRTNDVNVLLEEVDKQYSWL